MSPPPSVHLRPSQNGSREFPRLREPRYSQSLERGLAILGCFTPERPVRGIADISDQLGISRSTTHRYVITLSALGYLKQDASRRYRLGLRVADVGMSALNAIGLREHAGAHLRELRQESTHTASLAVLNGPEIVYVERARSFRREQGLSNLGLARGSRLPAHCTALGKVLLAYLPEREQGELLSAMELARRGPNTIVSRTALRVELEAIREAGFAVSDQELARGLLAIAAPVRGSGGQVLAAVNLAAHTSMTSLQELVDAFGQQLVRTADRVSAELGYHPERELMRGR